MYALRRVRPVRRVLPRCRGFRTSARVCQQAAPLPNGQPQQSLGSLLKYFSIASAFLVGGLIEGYWLGKVPVKESSIVRLEDVDKPFVYATEALVNEGVQKILRIVGPENITLFKGEIESHSGDPSGFVPPKKDERPYCIVYPTTTEQVSQVVRVCYELRIPVVPCAGGTSIEGNYVPTRKGVSIDLSHMNKVLAVHEDDFDCVVQPGVDWMGLNEELKPKGLMFAPDPAPGALIGGIVSTNASGTNAFKFGGARDNVLSLKVVLPDGTVIKTKQRSRKSSNGYNLTNLFIGAEGTLGIVVEATLKLHILPKKEAIALVNFKDIGDATRMVVDLVKSGVDCGALELMDSRQMVAVAEMDTGGDRQWAPEHLMFVKLGRADEDSLNKAIRAVQTVAVRNKGFNFDVATSDEDREAVWHMRKTQLWNAMNWARRIKPDCEILPTDVCVPVSQMPALISKVMGKMDAAGLLATASGHAGDGNVHVMVIYNPDQVDTAHRLINEMSRAAIELEGTVSGEHGIGVSDKRELLVEELGADTIGAMRSIKFALDPRGIMNPDHIFSIDPKEHRRA